jgi:hypothetical protein
MSEEWRTVIGHPLYMVSDFGRVYSHRSQKYLRPGIASNGYPTVRLNGKKTRTVHSLVIEAFIGPRPDKMEVRHKDGNRRNFVLNNLCYGTPSENQADAYRHGSRNAALDLEVGRRTRDTKLRRNPEFFVFSNQKGTSTKDKKYSREWSRKSFAGEKYAR